MTETHPVNALLSSGAAQGEWTLDPAGSTVTFGVKHFWGAITVHGGFEQLAGAGTVAPDGSVSGQLTMQASSLSTKNKQRDKPLHSAFFFNTEHPPQVVLYITEATPTISGEIFNYGTLQLFCHSQPIF